MKFSYEISDIVEKIRSFFKENYDDALSQIPELLEGKSKRDIQTLKYNFQIYLGKNSQSLKKLQMRKVNIKTIRTNVQKKRTRFSLHQGKQK